VKSLIEHAIALEIGQDIHLYRIACKPGDEYLSNVCRSWSDAIDNFHYHPLQSALPGECNDEAGLAKYDRLLSVLGGGDMQSIFGSDVYLSGTGPVVENLARAMLAQGLAEEQLKIQLVE
jgi:CDP-4-dehydro-6-deoxyglucose reductase